ncbi:hypothetical protein MOQ_006391 [Trypanosoma cruzi marinkellei]|uniref:Uncharacterized protein n=1 Tax=Trypanosoma cruzi marinkellei TaxID=85056 RepID=K2M4B3_TRYCR|nr:hypothetical protein MOQ_006391 [Trypanosoma cruzi marinkellei]
MEDSPFARSQGVVPPSRGPALHSEQRHHKRTQHKQEGKAKDQQSNAEKNIRINCCFSSCFLEQIRDPHVSHRPASSTLRSHTAASRPPSSRATTPWQNVRTHTRDTDCHSQLRLQCAVWAAHNSPHHARSSLAHANHRQRVAVRNKIYGVKAPCATHSRNFSAAHTTPTNKTAQQQEQLPGKQHSAEHQAGMPTYTCTPQSPCIVCVIQRRPQQSPKLSSCTTPPTSHRNKEPCAEHTHDSNKRDGVHPIPWNSPLLLPAPTD